MNTAPSPNADSASRDAAATRVVELIGAAHHAHPPPATTGGGLHERRVGDRRRRHRPSTTSIIDVVGHTRFECRALCRHLVAEQRHLFRRRADPHEAGVDHRLRERSVLGEEAVAGMDRVGAGCQRRGDDGVAAQVRLGRCRTAESDGDIDRIDVRVRCGRAPSTRRRCRCPGDSQCGRYARRSRRGWR